MIDAVEPAKAGDLDAVLQLLRDNALPVDGLADHPANTLAVPDGDRIVGGSALEVYGDVKSACPATATVMRKLL